MVNFIDGDDASTEYPRETAINRLKIINKIGASRASIATDILFVENACVA